MASVGLHLAAFAVIRLDAPAFERPEPGRALRVVELPDDWADRALEVVPLETASVGADPGSAPAVPAAASAIATPVETRAPETASTVALASSDASRALALTAATAVASDAPRIASRRPNRGIVVREGPGPVTGASLDGFGLYDDDGKGFGIGISVVGVGGDCDDPGLNGIPVTRVLGGLVSGSPARGILGRRPPGGEAINRIGPARRW